MKINTQPWEWFTEKVLPGLFLCVATGVAAASFGIWQSVSDLAATIKSHEKRLDKIEIQTQQLVTRTELLETLKRVEQQLQIVLLQAGIRQKVELK